MEEGSTARSGLADLSEGGHLLIWGARHWMMANLRRACVPLSVSRVFELLGESAAFAQLASVILLVARDADRPLVILPPCSPELSADEDALARAVAAASDTGEVRQQLRSCVGCDPTAALVRSVIALASVFRSAGLRVAFPTGGDSVDIGPRG